MTEAVKEPTTTEVVPCDKCGATDHVTGNHNTGKPPETMETNGNHNTGSPQALMATSDTGGDDPNGNHNTGGTDTTNGNHNTGGTAP